MSKVYCKRCGARLLGVGGYWRDKFSYVFCARRYGCLDHVPYSKV